MNLSFLSYSRTPPAPTWQEAKVDFLGGQSYVLRRYCTEASIKVERGGFRIIFRRPFLVPSAELLGTQVKEGFISDIVVTMSGFEFSMQKLYPETFPRRILRGMEVGINLVI